MEIDLAKEFSTQLKMILTPMPAKVEDVIFAVLTVLEPYLVRGLIDMRKER